MPVAPVRPSSSASAPPSAVLMPTARRKIWRFSSLSLRGARPAGVGHDVSASAWRAMCRPGGGALGEDGRGGGGRGEDDDGAGGGDLERRGACSAARAWLGLAMAAASGKGCRAESSLERRR